MLERHTQVRSREMYVASIRFQATFEKSMSGFIGLPTEGYTQGGRFWVGVRRDQELEGADNTRFRQVQAAICVIPYVLYGGLYCLDVDLVILVLRGSLPALIYPGGQGYMNPSLILA
jgi:hypothetical protein